ncbi:MAG: response regulator [Thermodesulfobacteriota bacterium]
METSRPLKKILVVDEDPEMRIFLSSLLEQGGYLPVMAPSGEEGLQKAFEESPDLIILALMITREGLVQMFDTLQEDEDLKEIPVIMISEVDEKVFSHCLKVQQAAPEGGRRKPEAYLAKPPEAEELLLCIERLTGRAGTRRKASPRKGGTDGP